MKILIKNFTAILEMFGLLVPEPISYPVPKYKCVTNIETNIKSYKELKEAFKNGDENAGKIITNLVESMKPIKENCRNCGAPHSGRCEYCGTSYK